MCVGVCVSGGEEEMILFMKSSGNEANPIRVEDRLTNPIMSVNWMHIVVLTVNCYSIIKLLRAPLSLYEQGKHGDKQPGEEATCVPLFLIGPHQPPILPPWGTLSFVSA